MNLVVKKRVALGSAASIFRNFESRNQLLGGISRMCDDEKFSDFTFVVKDKKFKLHKLVLAASSPVMERLFAADYEEKKTGQCQIDDIEPNIFNAMSRFMYTCTVPEKLCDIVCYLYAAAHYYEIQTLKDICLDEMQNNLSKENAVEVHSLAFKYDLELLQEAWKIIKQ